MRRQVKIFLALLLVVLLGALFAAFWSGLFPIGATKAPGRTPKNSGRCPNVSARVLPACQLERRRPEGGHTFCPRGVCAPGLKSVPDTKTAYMICIPKNSTVDEACP
jgi:hypothetical protein